MDKQKVFIIGSKGTPAKYGGFETFVDNLVTRQKSLKIEYFLACRRDLSQNKADIYQYAGAKCFNIDVPNIGPAKAIIYDVRALSWIVKYIRENNIKGAIIYILACRIGPFIGHYKRTLKDYHVTIFVNPDGHEWLRAKWSYPVKRYWKYSEKLMVKNADLLICDSRHIELYIRDSYRKYQPKTTYLSYGATIAQTSSFSETLEKWYKDHDIRPNQYYLIVGRFVPENNYQTMISEFIKSNTSRDLVIITGVNNERFYEKLEQKTHFKEDSRVKFVGTVYDKELLKQIREHAFAYLHGHEVGGTNPSLLEALGTTKLNLLLKVGFNEEVGQNGALYWTKKPGSLTEIINQAEVLPKAKIDEYAKNSKKNILSEFDWDKIVARYELTFLKK
ncbi:beta 1-4 rhamnosyltransferase Cps2T [Lacticaseibacillus rhamnosus]|uniref:beta 1-4 rhamnosyltransferase Cps2T n=1 Tax=Lacticaseibacillus rhamnosus TaxID=47715 RepID=UPI00281545B6|nr:DUF1972 domain-containing protein [Lacticaseibacillus rhamnosus]